VESGPWHEGRTAAGAAFRAPRLDAASAAAVASAVRNAALEARDRLSVEDVVERVAAAASRLANPADPIGQAASAVLEAELGWSNRGAAETLRGMAEGWTGEALLSLLRAELGDPGVLDGFRPDPDRPGRRRRASGPPLLLQVHAGNVPGVAVTGAIRGLLVRSGVLAKVAQDEPGLLTLFARALARADPLLGRCLAVTWWPGAESGTAPAWGVWAKHAGKVVVYGGDSAVAGVRAATSPDTEIVAYGPRLGAAVVLEDAPEAAVVGLARDLCAYDQRGCVSPRIAWVVGADPLATAERIGAALAAEVSRVAPPPPGDAEAVELRAARAEAAFAGFAPEGPESTVLGPDDLAWTVIARRGPGADSRALPRALWVYGAESVSQVMELLAPFAGRVQALGYAGNRGLDELAEGAARLGVSRVAPIGTLAWPPSDWRHEGRHQLLPLLAWTDFELPS
jgi:hypothetical protein